MMTSAPGKVNILLVDDQPAKLLSYEVVLAELGENLIKASSAQEALGHLLKTDVAVILVDVCMPELDGFELVAMIREHPRFQRTAIIFVSAIQITDLDRLRGYEAGAVDYVPVPVVPEVLRAKVRVFAELYRKTRQLEVLNAELEQRVAERTAALEATASELKQLNDELEQRIEDRTRERESALAQLFEAQKLDTIGQLTGSVAHDFNNLLMAVIGSLQLLRKRLPDDPRCHRLLDNALLGADRGAALTQRLLSFARRQELKPQAVHLAGLVAGMEDLFKRALGPLVQVHQNFPSDLPPVRADANQLELALLNIAINARDAMPLGGLLRIAATAETVEADDPSRRLSRGDYVRICVSDNGVGMDAETLAKATEPFFTTKGPGKGTGLGLSMVHGLAAQSGGSLTISSRKGEGTSVELWLPQVADTVAALPLNAKTTTSHDMLPVAPCSVLVVDDDPLVMMGTVSMLEDLGHTAVEARSAAEALAALRAGRRVDIVVTDHAMPEMTGTQLANRLREEFPDMPVILATGYAEIGPEDQAACPNRLAKPFTIDDLAAALATVRRSGGLSGNVVPLRPGGEREAGDGVATSRR
ncbi:response regulator [Alsobacter sp. SYSU M60028]|uniref:histidine kinase n=1 Tax=Alsobacter ponti TaxID=2962936 RepID=A0ABT1LCJ6_9HYPH|nr:response regulator [Alsobacter ponti]MCP8938465.1 response regulator [Alsobacter ponti]